MLPSGNYRQQLMDSFAAANHMPRIAYETRHVATMLSLVAAGCGVAILPESLCEADDRIATLALEPALYLEPVLAWKRNRHASHAAEALQQCLATEEG